MLNFSLRKKIFISYLIVFLVFIALMFPFATKTVKGIVIKSLDDRASELISKIQSAPNNEALVQYLKDQKSMIFFRVGILTNERKILYDTHTKRLLGPKFSQEYVVEHPEIFQAIQEGTGYYEDYSEILGQKFAYYAKVFNFHDKAYVLRTAFPYKYVSELTRDFEIGFLMLSSGALLLFSVMTWFIIHRLTSPIDQIITAIKPYQEGRQTTIPEIKLGNLNSQDDFGRLAMTLNSLSLKIQNHINSLIKERNEKVAILESLIEGVVAVDQGMKVTYANDMALKVLGIESNSFVGRFFSEVRQSVCEELLKSCQERMTPMTGAIQLKSEGRKLFLDLVAAPTNDTLGAILVLQDKTAHYKMMEMRKDFVANASHELKTPITIIRGFAEALHDNPDLPLETRIEVTDKIVRNCKRMTNVIKDLLILSDVENLPRSRVIDCDVEDLLVGCRSMLLELFPDATVMIEKKQGHEFSLSADPDLIELALFNLMENAAKYSNSPAQITISLDKEDAHLKISVADKGIGIPSHDIENVFQRFYTVDKAHSQKMGGSGLGLSIVETIIDKHCGKISVASTVGKGTTFTILLPYELEKIL